MLDACNDIIDFINGKSFENFCNEKVVRFAVERQLLVIGEASKKISKETQVMYEDIPWKKIIGLRNVLAHEYGEILVERVWKIGIQSIPPLQARIKKILEE